MAVEQGEKGARKMIVAEIKDMIEDLNGKIKIAAMFGITSEFLLDAIEDDNAYHQTLRVVLSERL